MKKESTRNIRVFISSTFRDMQAERDELTLRIFPELRARCRERNLNLVEVDLRWGITEEQERQGKVLSLCLDQVDQSRPYFIGLLGERYGTIPETIDDKIFQNYPWLKKHKNKSLTELEMLHGVLFNISAAKNAFFYFRSPEYYQNLDKDEQVILAENDPEKLKRQEELKQQIREEGLKILDGYVNPEDLGKQVLEDIWSAIDREYPKIDIKNREDEKLSEQDTFEEITNDLYVNRNEEKAIDEKFKNSDFIAITGEPGSGKTSLLKNWVKNFSNINKEYIVLKHYSGDISNGHSLEVLQDSFISQIGKTIPPNSQFTSPHSDKGKLLNAVLNELVTQKPVLIAIDSLDHLYGKDGLHDIGVFKNIIPHGVKLVCSIQDEDSLQKMKETGWEIITANPLTLFQREIIITQYLIRFGKQLNQERSRKISQHPLCSNPLFLRTILEELRVDARHEELDNKIANFLSVNNFTELFKIVLNNYELRAERLSPGVLKRALCFLFLSQNGLTENEVLNLLGTPDKPLSYHDWSIVYLTIQESLKISSGRILLRHKFIKKAVQQVFLNTLENTDEIRNELIVYFQNQDRNKRNVLELAYQFLQTNQINKLKDLLIHSDLFHYIFDPDAIFLFIQYYIALEKEYDLVSCLKEIFSTHEQKVISIEDSLEFNTQLGKFAYLLNKAEAAVYFHGKNLEKNQKLYGWDNDKTISSMGALALALEGAENTTEAKRIFRKTLALCHKKYGLENSFTIRVLSGLAICYAKLKHPDAEKLFKKTLELSKKINGADGQETIFIMDNMANHLEENDNIDIIKLHQDALDFSIKTMGANHVDTAKCYDNLAGALLKQKKWEEAIPYIEKAIVVFQNKLGESHKDTQIALANLHAAVGHSDNIEKLVYVFLRRLNSGFIFERSGVEKIINELRDLSQYFHLKGNYELSKQLKIKISEILNNSKETTNLKDKCNLALLLYEQGLFTESFNAYNEVLNEIIDKKDEFEIQSWCLLGMGKNYVSLGRFDDAYSYLQQALDLTNKVEKVEDSVQSECLNFLSRVQIERGDIASAEENCDKAIELSEKSVHGNTAALYDLKGQIATHKKNFDEGEHWFQKAYDISAKEWGKEHPMTITSLNNLGSLYKQKGDFEKAEDILHKVIDLRTQLLGEEHPKTGNSVNVLAELLFEKKDFENAEKQYQKVVKNLKRNFKDDFSSISDKKLLIAECQMAQKKNSEALITCKEVQELFSDNSQTIPAFFWMEAMEKIFRIYATNNEYELAEETIRKIIDFMANQQDIHQWQKGKWQLEWGTALTNMGEIIEATPHYEIAYKILLDTLGEENNITQQAKSLLETNEILRENELYSKVNILLTRSEQYLLKGDFGKAKKNIDKAENICMSDFDEKDILIVKLKSAQGAFYSGKKEYSNAVEEYKNALGIGQKLIGEENAEIITLYSNLANALVKNNNYGEAAQIYKYLLSREDVYIHRKSDAIFDFYSDYLASLINLGENQQAIEAGLKATEHIVRNSTNGGSEAIVSYITLNKVFRQHSSPDVEKVLLEEITQKVPIESPFWELCGMYVYFNLAEIHRKSGNDDIALSCYEKVLRKEYGYFDLDTVDTNKRIPEGFGHEWVDSLYYLIFLRDIPQKNWDVAADNYQKAQRILDRPRYKVYSLFIEFAYYSSLVESGQRIDIKKARESAKMYTLSGNIDKGVNAYISDLSVAFRSQNILEEAEFFSVKALELDKKIHDDNDPIISSRLRNVSIIYLLKKQYDQAIIYSTEAWKIISFEHSLITARLLVVRIVLGILLKKNYSDYLGQLKTLLLDFKNENNEHYIWNSDILNDFMKDNATEEDALFIEMLTKILNMKEEHTSLNKWDIWNNQQPVSLDIPWPANGY